MCGACKMTGCIDPCGNVFPCAFMQDTQFCGGNLREKMTRHSRESGNPGEGFKDIWDNAAAFKYFRQLEPKACQSCSRFEKCRGGCPAVAYFVSRDLNNSDPECLINWSRDATAVTPITAE
jgi:radical SAM protein with 4Fe4S-binding SPASM domain